MDSSNSSRERDQSRICVEHIDEWNKVKHSFTEALVETLNAKVGSAPSAERDALLAHLMQWRDRTFELSKQNVQVNGINMEQLSEEEEEDELEPYDEVLDRRLWTHFEEGLSWHGTLATRRRTEPGNAQRLIEDLIARERNLEVELAPPQVDVDKPIAAAEAPVPERLPTIGVIHQEAMQMVEDWRESLPELIEKADRMEAVAAVDSRLTP